MVYGGLYADKLTRLNVRGRPTGRNVRRMFHLTALKHVRPNGGITKHGLRSRIQLGMPWPKSSQSWCDDGTGKYLTNEIASGLDQAQGGSTGLVVVDVPLGKVWKAKARRPKTKYNPFARDRLFKHGFTSVTLMNKNGAQQWSTLTDDMYYVYVGPIGGFVDDGEVRTSRLRPYPGLRTKQWRLLKLREAFKRLRAGTTKAKLLSRTQPGGKEWTAADDEIIQSGVAMFGGKWRRIAAQLPGRSETAIRNRWNRLEKHEARSASAKVTASQCSSGPCS